MAPARTEPLRNVDPDRALQLVLAAAAPLGAVEVELARALGSVLDESVVADRDYPPFDRAMMDGFAVRVADAGRELPVAGEVAAGHVASIALPHDAVVAIMTGAPCPAGTEAVVPVEAVGEAHGKVRLPQGVTPGQNVAPRGSECRAGSEILMPGQEVQPLRLALLASVGRKAVRVRRPPSMAVISTGDELVTAAATPGAAQIRSSNGPMLAAMATLRGVKAVTQLHAGDELGALRAALEAASDHDMILTIGGVSAGRYDLVPEAIAAYGATTVFHRVRQKPGHPLLFATKAFARPRSNPRARQLIFGLPGNPLSAHLGFHRYVRPAIRVSMGLDPEPPTSAGVLTEPITVSGTRSTFRLCRIQGSETGWQVTPAAERGSADVFAAASADALVRLEPAPDPYPPGSEVRFEWLGHPRAAPQPVRGSEAAAGPGAGGLLLPIAARRSLRAFDSRPVPYTLLARALEAARWAPSAGNSQPWRFVLAHRGGPAFARLTDTLRPNNAWARQAPHLLLLAAKELLEHPEKPPRPNHLTLLEVGLALENLLIQATADGLLAHPFDGFDAEAAGDAVGVPAGYRVAVLVAIGRPGDPAALDDRTREKDARPRQRLPQSEFVFEESWGRAAQLED